MKFLKYFTEKDLDFDENIETFNSFLDLMKYLRHLHVFLDTKYFRTISTKSH